MASFWVVIALISTLSMASGTIWSQEYTLNRVGRVPEGPIVHIINRGTRKCVDNAGASPDNGSRVQMWGCNGSAAQRWIRILSDDRLYFRLKNVASGKCIDINGQSSFNGAKLHQWTCGNQYSQQWLQKSDGHIQGRHSGKCIDILGQNAASGTGLHTWSCL